LLLYLVTYTFIASTKTCRQTEVIYAPKTCWFVGTERWRRGVGERTDWRRYGGWLGAGRGTDEWDYGRCGGM